MGREAISDSLLLGRTGLREDISPNQSLDDPTSTSTSLTPNWVLEFVNDSMREMYLPPQDIVKCHAQCFELLQT